MSDPAIDFKRGRSRRSLGRLIALPLAAALAAMGLTIATVGTAGADVTSVSGSAFGLQLTGLIPFGPSPTVTLPASGGGPFAESLVNLALPTSTLSLLTIGAANVSTEGPNVPGPEGEAESSATLANVDVGASLAGVPIGVPSLGALTISAITASCVSTDTGSTGGISGGVLDIGGQSINLSPPGGIPPNDQPVPLASLPAGILSLELNKQTQVDVRGHTSLQVIGLYLSIGVNVAGIGTGALTVEASEVSCGASGPDVETPPTVTNVVPRSGPVKGGNTVTVLGTGFDNVSAVHFGSKKASKFTVISSDQIEVTAPPGAVGPVNVTVTNSFGTSPTSDADIYTYIGPGVTAEEGYWLVASDGGIFTFGHAKFHGSAGAIHLKRPIVGMAPAANGKGYWLVASDGGIFAYGSAKFYGSEGAKHLNAPVVGMAASPDGKGYWLVASDGGIFSFGDAKFHGSAGAIHLKQPIVGMAATPDGKGYWLVAYDGGIFSYGDAKYYGSEGAKHLNAPIVGMASTTDGHGYWLVASDGGIFSFGDAKFHGSAGAIHLKKPIVGMATTPDGRGYWFDASDGGVFAYGDAHFFGSEGAKHLNKPVVGMAPSFTES